MIGNSLAHYEITALLGRGGMGEVYLARDGKLERDVAIKVLPDVLARDKDLIARFAREAKLLATLNHQNIAGIYELGFDAGTHFLVMELVDGPGLDERLHSGTLAMEETLALFGQLAEALEFAHERGVIHRDLKPANVKISGDDTVKILDFGLAKAFETQADSSIVEDGTVVLGSDSSVLETVEGRILGTPAYMSPEQARGRPVDKRTDIWAFGCCLYEALTGQRPFQGPTTTDVLAEIMKSDPEWDRLPDDTPARVRVLLWRCLQKDPRRRLRDIGEARLELSGETTDPSGVLTSLGTTAHDTGFSRKSIVAACVIALVAGSIVTGVAVRSFFTPASEVAGQERPVTRFDIDIGLAEPLQILNISAEVAISPDGRRIAYTANLDGAKRLYVRDLDGTESVALPGTENSWHPFFSPDGQWIGYTVPGSPASRQGRLMKIAVDGGTPLDLCHAFPPAGGTWLDDGTIVFTSQDDDLNLSADPFLSHLFSVSENGGTPQRIVQAEAAERNILTLVLPKAAAGQDFFLFTMVDQQFVRHASIYDLESQTHETLLENALGVQYASSGHLVFLRDGALWAAAFDPASRTVGEPAVVQPGVQMNQGAAAMPFALSREGSLVYPPDTVDEKPDRRLVWVDHEGREETVAVPPAKYWWPRVSPDGSRVAMSVDGLADGNEDIWVHHLERAQSMTRLTFDPNWDSSPLWSPDSNHLYFASERSGSASLFRRRADGADAVQAILSGSSFAYPGDVTPDGQTLLFGTPESDNNFNIHELDIPAPGQEAVNEANARRLLRSKFAEGGTKLSPDGRWLAYNTDETTPTQVFVRPYPNLDSGRWQVSTDGGINPTWSADGREIYYRNGNKMMAVSVETEPTFRPGRARELFEADYYYAPDLSVQYDLEHPSRSRFLMLKEQLDTRTTKLMYVGNWIEELREIVPSSVR